MNTRNRRAVSKNQKLITDVMARKPKKFIPPKSLHQNEIVVNKSKNDLMNVSTRSNNTKKRKRSEFEALQQAEVISLKDKKQDISYDRKLVEEQKGKKEKIADTKLMQTLALISNQKPQSKRFKHNEDKNNNEQIFLKQKQINTQKIQEEVIKTLEHQVNKNIGVKKVRIQAELNEQKMQIEEEKKVCDPKRRGRPACKKNDLKLKTKSPIEVEDDKQRSQTKPRLQSGSSQIQTNNSSAIRNNSADSKQPLKTMYMEAGITDRKTLASLNIQINTRTILKTTIIYTSLEDKQKAQHLKLNIPSEEELITKHQDDNKIACAYLKENKDHIQLLEYMKRRKNRVKKELIESDALLTIYRQWVPLKDKADKYKKPAKMKINYESSDDEEMPDINESDLGDDFFSDQEQIQDKIIDSLEQDQLRKGNDQLKQSQEVWIDKKQNKSNTTDQVEFNFGELKNSLENSDEQDDLMDMLKDVDQGQNHQRFIPPSMNQEQSNVNFQKGKGYKGNENRFGQKEPGGKPQLMPSVRIEMKPEELLKKQFSFQVENHTVYFPFNPYACQKDFMGKVIKALNQNENALLESPTGTGKTLSLLCASLAWLKNQREKAGSNQSNFDVPRIIYTSRTHSQLAQVQKELRNTAYKPRSVIIGSRDHLCVHPEIKLLRGHALNTACKKAQKDVNPCAYGKNRDIAIKNLTWEPLDIEELHTIANKMIICPYFASKDRIQGADIIFMPYNYLIDAKIRENFEVNYKGSVIIFDEAHNASSTAEDVASFEIVAKTLEMTQVELQKLQDERQIQEDSFNFKSNDEDTSSLIQMTKAFHRYLEDFDMNQRNVKNFRIDQQYLKEGSVVMPGHEIFEIFKKGTECITYFKFDKNTIVQLLDRVSQEQKVSNIFADWQKWQTAFDNALSDISTLQQMSVKTSLETWYDIIKRIIRLSSKNQKSKQPGEKEINPQNQDADNFYVYVYDEEDQSNNQLTFNNQKRKKGSNIFVQKTWSRTLAFWCFNAGIGFREIQELMPRSIILTSGTLSPLNSFQAELQLNFNQRLENPHVINPDQVSINILTRGIRDSQFNFSFQNRDNENSLVDLGLTIANIASVTPGGMLVFFPSYRVLQKCDEVWTNTQVRQAIEKEKKLFLEPKDSSKYQSTMDQFYKAIFQAKKNEKTNGAILMGVCRGRISEGLDFSDNAARCVMVIGIPYPQMTDAKVILKKDFLDKRINQNRANGTQGTPEFSTLSGKDWYSQQATRAVNQAIGRVIRHVQDYGSIILVDERYNWGTIRSQLSKWLRDRIQVQNKCSEMHASLKDFYIQMSQKGFKAKVEQLGQIQLEIEGAKKIDGQNSEDEEAKGGLGFVQNIYKKRIGNEEEKTVENRGTISRFFKVGKEAQNQLQKRTLNDIKETRQDTRLYAKKNKLDPTITISINNGQQDQFKNSEPQKKNNLGFMNDEEEILDILDRDNKQTRQDVQPQESFGLQSKSASTMLSTDKLKEFSYNPTKRNNQTATIPIMKRDETVNQSTILNDSAQQKSGGIYTSDKQEIENKQLKNKLLIDGFKKVLNKEDLMKLIGIIKDIKNCQQLNPVFSKLRETIFGRNKDITNDRNFKEKMRLIESLGDFIPKGKKEEYQSLMENIS